MSEMRYDEKGDRFPQMPKIPPVPPRIKREENSSKKDVSPDKKK